MDKNEIILYYDDLMRLAVSKCGTQTDAEDLVSDTLLAAFMQLRKGIPIECPKTWLANTLCHKYHDNLRRKYRMPVTVCFDDIPDVPAEEDEDDFSLQEAAEIRKEINHLAFITREVMIRYYFGKQSVAEIAAGLGIPDGTVKSRLSAGRNQMKKGLEKMETTENHLPGKLYLSFGGSDGPNFEPESLVENDLIAQNLLILAYDKPLTVSELSKSIGIPAAYIEPIINRLVNGELMVQTDGGKVYSDFLITKPQNQLAVFQSQLDFAHRHFETIWSIIEQMSLRITDMECVRAMGDKEKIKLDRFAVLKALQDFQHYGTGKIEAPHHPKRKDGGQWTAQAMAVEAGYNMTEYNNSMEYAIHGGHRISEEQVENGRRVRLHEFDTTLWDCPHRYGGADTFELYFKYIIPLLWDIYSGIPADQTAEIPNEFLSYIPKLEEFGLLGNTQGKPTIAIPVFKKTDFDEICAVIEDAAEQLKTAIGNELSAFVLSKKTPIPKHLTSVPELFRYSDATTYLVMAVVREAYEKGLHLKNVDYCCPPVVLVYEE